MCYDWIWDLQKKNFRTMKYWIMTMNIEIKCKIKFKYKKNVPIYENDISKNEKNVLKF